MNEEPRDLNLEYSVIGALLIDFRCMREVAGKVRAEDFSISLCGRVFEMASEAYITGKPFDPVLVTKALTEPMGYESASQFVRECMEITPTIANAVYHAELLHKSRQAQNLQNALRDMAFTCDDPDELAKQAIDVCRGYLETQNSTRLKPLSEVMKKYFELKNEPRSRIRVDTGYPRLDGILKGLWGGQLIIVGARPGVGKAQPLTSNLLTPNGWIKMGDVRIGDQLIAANGAPTRVTGLYPQGEREVYRVTFDDYTHVDCDAEHLWEVSVRADRKKGKTGKRVLTTSEMTKNVLLAGDRKNYRIDYVKPVRFSGELTSDDIHPYLLGVLIGDGELCSTCVRLTNPDEDIISKVKELLPDGDILSRDRESINYRIKKSVNGSQVSLTKTAIRKYGLEVKSKDKHIPEKFLYANLEVRRELLAGLMDSDGCAGRTDSSYCEYSTVSKQLAADFMELVRSLGYRATLSSKTPHYTQNGEKVFCQIAYRIIFNGDENPFYCQRKRQRFVARKQRQGKYIASIKKIGKAECQCVMVEDERHLYVTEGYNLTHNTAFATDLALTAAKAGNRTAIYSLEMEDEEVGERMVSRAGGVDMNALIDLGPQVKDVALWKSIGRACAELSNLPVLVNDDPATSPARIAREARTVEGLKFLVVDYLTLLKSDKANKNENRNLEVAAMTREMKLLAKELHIPVMVLSQLSRKKDATQEPILSDLRDSGAIEQDADKVIFLWDTEEGEDNEHPVIGVSVPKNRRGAKGKVKMLFDGAHMTFTELSESFTTKKSTAKRRRSIYEDDVE